MSEEASFESVNEKPPYQVALDKLRAELPEVDEDYELISKMADSLVETYGIKPEFFDSPTHTLFFASLAQRAGRLRYESNLDGRTRMREEHFIDSALTLLLLDKNRHYERRKEDIGTDTLNVQQAKKAGIEKFTNAQLSEELVRAIDGGLLDGVKKRLGITEESPYEVRVLSIGNRQNGYGLQPPTEEIDYSTFNWEMKTDLAYFNQYIKDLEKRESEFRNLTGIKNILMFKEVIDGKQVICLPQTYAEKFLYPEEPRSPSYDDYQKQGELAFLEHEYIHTQHSLALDDEIFYGMALEERRAEYFSGDRHGYEDVKDFFSDLFTISGVDIKDVMEETKSQPPENLYRQLANIFGLQWTLEMALNPPNKYFEYERPLQKAIHSHLGGPDALLEKMYRHLQSVGKKDEVHQRIKQASQSFLDKNTRDQWYALRVNHQVTFVPNLIAKELGLEPDSTQQ